MPAFVCATWECSVKYSYWNQVFTYIFGVYLDNKMRIIKYNIYFIFNIIDSFCFIIFFFFCLIHFTIFNKLHSSFLLFLWKYYICAETHSTFFKNYRLNRKPVLRVLYIHRFLYFSSVEKEKKEWRRTRSTLYDVPFHGGHDSSWIEKHEWWNRWRWFGWKQCYEWFEKNQENLSWLEEQTTHTNILQIYRKNLEVMTCKLFWMITVLSQ